MGGQSPQDDRFQGVRRTEYRTAAVAPGQRASESRYEPAPPPVMDIVMGNVGSSSFPAIDDDDAHLRVGARGLRFGHAGRRRIHPEREKTTQGRRLQGTDRLRTFWAGPQGSRRRRPIPVSPPGGLWLGNRQASRYASGLVMSFDEPRARFALGPGNPAIAHRPRIGQSGPCFRYSFCGMASPGAGPICGVWQSPRHSISLIGGAMRHPLRSVAVVGVAILTSTGLALPAQATGHKTWTVWPGTGTITAALAKAHPGDTLKLRPGSFLDSVVVTIPLTIRGSGWSTVIKPPPNPSTSGFGPMGS